jgi:uncharacterized protein YkwD
MQLVAPDLPPELDLPPQAPLEATATPAAPAEASPAPAATSTLEPTATPPPPTPRSATPRPQATATPAPAAAQPPAATVSLSGLEQELFASHNAERGQAGLAGLQLDGVLVSVARQRAQDMAAKGYFSHTSPAGQTAFTLLSAAGYAHSLAGENIARNNYPNSQSADVAMTGFMNSAGHRANILDRQFTAVGVGAAVGADGMKYFAVVFASR